MRFRRSRAVVAALVAAAVLAVSVGSPAAQGATADVYGDPASATVENLQFGLEEKLGRYGYWVKCTFVAYWRVKGDGLFKGYANIHLDWSCRTGIAVLDHPLTVTMQAGGGCTFQMFLGNVDDDAHRNGGAWMSLVDQEGCDPVTRLCVAEGTGDDVEGEGCYALPLGAPPDGQQPGTETAATCARGTVLPPWVEQPVARGASGAWRWEFDVTLRIDGVTSRTSHTVGGANPYLYHFVTFRGNAGLGNDFEILTPGISGTKSLVGQDTIGIPIDSLPTPSQTVVKVRVKTDVYTGEVGSTPFTYVYFSGGTYASPFSNSYANALESFGSGTFTEAYWAGASNRGARYAGHNRPGWCFLSWGKSWAGVSDTTGEAEQLGNPVPEQIGDPPPYTAPKTDPPNVVIQPPSETCPVGSTCVDPGEEPYSPPNSVPDPEDESCDFAITDPSTWGGQIVCALAAIAGLIVDAIAGVVKAIGGLVTALLDGLLALFVPDEFPDFSGIESPLPEGWLPSLPDIPTGACGPMTLPSLDMGDMVGQTDAVEYLNTCEAPWTTARIVTYYGLLAVVLIGAGSRALRIVMTGLGMNVDAPTGKDED